MIRDLGEIDLRDKLEYGGKTACMGELLKNNINVPKGFALSSKIFNEILEYNHFPYKPKDYLEYNDEICDFIIKCEFPTTIKDKIQCIFKELSTQSQVEKYIVRSSALCEDTDSYSFAGVFESYDNLTSLSDILNSIKKCYASMFSGKALSYMWSNGITFDYLQMGVLVQEFIPGSLSGVAFSVDTINMDDSFMHINVVNGFCSDFVNGKLSSGLYKIDKATGLIDNSSVLLDTQLSNTFINELYEKILKVEKIFGCFQDIEWTMKEGKAYFLQARPITTFRSKDFPIKWIEKKDAQYNWRLGPDIPFPPLVQSLCPVEAAALDYGVLNAGYAHRRAARCIQNGYIYFRDLEMDNWQKIQDKFMSRVDQLFNEGKNIFQDVLLPQLVILKSQLDSYIQRELTRQEAVTYLDTAVLYFIKAWRSHWPAVHGRKYRRVFEEYCKEIIGDIDLVDFYDLIYTPSMASNERKLLIQMAETVISDNELNDLFRSNPYDEIVYHHLNRMKKGEKLLEQINSYLRIYGMCESGYQDFLSSVLFMRPEVIIKKIRPLLNLDIKAFLYSVKRTQDNKHRIIELINSRIGKDKENDFFKKLEMAEKAFLTGDDHNYYIDSSAWGYLKIAVYTAGKILLANGSIHDISDVLYLSFEELKNVLLQKLSVNLLIPERKKLYHEQKKLFPPHNIGKLSEEPYTLSKTDTNTNEDNRLGVLLKGIPGLRKNVQGTICLNIPNQLEQDSILVIWNGHCGDIMHIINKVKGLIFADGSPFDHLGIVAREMNIPTLYYVKDSFEILKDGDLVELDGVNGQVIILNSDQDNNRPLE